MKVINQTIPFSEKIFTVELTGLELAFIKKMTEGVAGCPEKSVRVIADTLHEGNPVICPADQILYSDARKISLAEFRQKINDLNK